MKKTTVFLFACLLLLAAGSGCSKTERDLFATLHGIVSDTETNEPISGASVVLAPGGKTKTTGSDGRYEFADLDPAQYTVTVQKTGYTTNRKTVTAVVGEDTEANIPMTQSN
jgi:uncharacterized membrane protein